MQGKAVLLTKEPNHSTLQFLKERQSILVGLVKVCATLAPIMQFYIYRIDRKSNGCKMVKGTCLAALQRKTGTPQRLGPGSPRRTAPTQCYLTQSKHKQSINKMQ
jgi:hypothetical protein